MANFLAKAIKLKKKEFALKTKRLYPKGIKSYILKRDGRTQSFVILAIFDNYGIMFDSYRSTEVFKFAVSDTETFTQGSATRTMREVAAIGSHIALVKPDSDSVMYEIRKGDEFDPYYLDFVWKFAVKQIGDRFNPADNL